MKVHLLNVRLSFPDLWAATAINDGKPKFGGDFLLVEGSEVLAVKEDGTKVKTTMEKVQAAVAKEAWKDRGAAVLEALEPSKKCYRNGNRRLTGSGDVYDGYADTWFVTAKNASRPTIIGRNRETLTESDGRPYSGCFVNAIIDVYAMKEGDKRGVFATLTGVQFVKDGDAFAGGRAADADEFDDLGSDTAEEAAAEMEDLL